MRSGEWIQVVQFLQRNMQMAPNDVGRGKRLPGSSAEQESSFAAANELFEPSGNHRMKIDLTDGIGSLEPFLDLSATNLLLHLFAFAFRCSPISLEHRAEMLRGPTKQSLQEQESLEIPS
jgi:hypothetical protein